MTVTPIDLFAYAVHLRRDGRLRAERTQFDAERDGWQLTAFHADSDADLHADHWEIHPHADELVSCLSGGLRLVLGAQEQDQKQEDEDGHRDGGEEEEEEIALTAGTAAIVPRGRRHRLELDSPGDLLSLTLPRGTRLAERAPD